MESEPLLRTIEARVHGRYLVRTPRGPGPWPALFSFHGYGEDASANMSALTRIPNASEWLLIAVQALHPFYTKKQAVVASWMTRQDRGLAIADNVGYVTAVVAAVSLEFQLRTSPMVFAGFSQGVAMAYRAAAHIRCNGVIALAGDVPPDVTQPLPEVLIGRGSQDDWYTDDKVAADVARLRGRSRHVETCVFAGGHEWTDAFASAAGAFLERLRRPSGP